MILAKIDAALFTQIAALVMGGGLGGGIVSWRKGKAESDGVVVESAERVVNMSTTQLERAIARHGTEMEEMRDTLRELKSQYEQAREEHRQAMARQSREATVAIAECQAERRELRQERDAARAINGELRQRIEALESEVARLGKP